MQNIFVLTLLEQAINTYLKAHTDYQKNLMALAGKTIAIKVKGLSIAFYMVFTAEHVYVQSTLAGEADLLISAPPFSLLHLFAKSEANSTLFSPEVEIRGDVLLAQQIKKIFAEMEIDWEYYLSLLFGDVVANESKNFITHSINRLKSVACRFSDNVVEYLQEEANVLPSKNLIADFFQQVDSFRNEIEILEKRIMRVENKLRQGKADNENN